MQRSSSQSDTEPLTIAGVEVNHPEKVIYPAPGITKAGVAAYYARTAPWMLPFLANRPLTLTRYPEGIHGRRFFEKEAPKGTPAWVETASVVAETTGKEVRYVVANRPESLVWLANLASIELHIPLSRRGSLDSPDFAFFDIDPEPPAGFSEAVDVALTLRETLSGLGLESFVKTSGKKGIHVIVPLAEGHTFPETRAFVHAIGRQLAREKKEIVAEFSASRVPGTIYVDYLQNWNGKTMVSPFSLRATETATVSTPLVWEEIETVSPLDFTIRTVPERANHWEGILELDQRLPARGYPENGRSRKSRANAGGARGGMRRSEYSSPDVGTGSAGEKGSLAEYEQKRDFTRTNEPVAAVPTPGSDDRFVVHEHHALRLHYDLRLERGDVLKSWAVPKGIPVSSGVRHLAIQTEDHPLEYATFEGTIPEGTYGAGTVEIWDAGRYETVTWETRKIEIVFHGRQLEGRYVMVAFGKAGPGQWLLFKAGR